MKIHSFTRLQMLPTDIATAWQFFSDPSNLAAITPAAMKFRMVYRSGGPEMYPGQLILHTVTVGGVRLKWLTEITHVQAPHYFVDEQRSGPYAFWQHQHRFREVSGGVEMTDEVNYAIPYGSFGRLANRVFVREQLTRIFNHREKILRDRFSGHA